jgi:dihydroorotate dehydrogenase (fumarate)
MLYGKVAGSLAATSGVWTADDAVQLLLAGADVTMMASAEYDSVEPLKGSVSQATAADPSAFARSNYMQMLVNFTSPYDWREIPGSVQA